MDSFNIVPKFKDKRARVGELIEIKGVGESLIIGYSSITGVEMVYSYKLQKIFAHLD